MELAIDQLITRGREAFERGDYVAALADFREVLEQNPQFADIRHLAGLCLSFLGQSEDALAEFDRAIEQNDGYIEAHLNRAITLNELGRYDDAREAFDRATEAEKHVGGRFPAAVSARIANGHLAVGDLYMAASAPQEAVREFRSALELRPLFHDIRNRLAEALMQLGEFEPAKHELLKAIEGNPNFFQARLNLGLCHFRTGAHDDARAEWQRCREQYPESPQVRAFLTLLDRTQRREA
ncbi:MAG TPA: tetratricopeptide repeat protein [Longimicrobiales bacterium]|nr:tetratricopeptide repeat protein [Longimicrobiales bacterium]